MQKIGPVGFFFSFFTVKDAKKGGGRGPHQLHPRSIANAWQGWRPLDEAATSAAVSIVWDRPGHLRESQPAPLPPPACSLLSPAPTRPARFVCATAAASLVAEGAEKTEKASRKPRQDPSPKPEGSLGPPRPQKAPAPCLLFVEPRSSLSSVSSRYTLPSPASLRCHDASGLELAPSRLEEGSRRLSGGGGRHRRICFPSSPPPSSGSPSLAARSRRTISERRPCIFNLASIRSHSEGSVAASRADNEGYGGSGALPTATSCPPAPISMPRQLRALQLLLTSSAPTPPTFTSIASVGGKKEEKS